MVMELIICNDNIDNAMKGTISSSGISPIIQGNELP